MDRPDFAPVVINYPQAPVYTGQSLAYDVVSGWTVIPGGSTKSLLLVHGRGRMTAGLVAFAGSFTWSDMSLIRLQIWIDGAPRAEWSLQDFELYIALNLINKASASGADGWYYPDVLHPVISPIGGRWNSTNNAFEEYYVYLNIVIEFTESIEVKIVNGLSSDITGLVRLMAGYYP